MSGLEPRFFTPVVIYKFFTQWVQTSESMLGLTRVKFCMVCICTKCHQSWVTWETTESKTTTKKRKNSKVNRVPSRMVSLVDQKPLDNVTIFGKK